MPNKKPSVDLKLRNTLMSLYWNVYRGDTNKTNRKSKEDFEKEWKRCQSERGYYNKLTTKLTALKKKREYNKPLTSYFISKGYSKSELKKNKKS